MRDGKYGCAGRYGLGQTTAAVSPICTCEHNTHCFCLKCHFGKTCSAVSFASYVQRNIDIWWTAEVSLNSLLCLDLFVMLSDAHSSLCLR